MPELPALSAEDVRRLAAENYSKGASIHKNGDVHSPWRTSSALHAEVKGSAAKPYDVSVGPRDDATYWARCTCPAARRQSLCKHAAALLVVWATTPKEFEVRAEPAPMPRAEDAPKVDSEARRARQPKADRSALGGLDPPGARPGGGAAGRPLRAGAPRRDSRAGRDDGLYRGGRRGAQAPPGRAARSSSFTTPRRRPARARPTRHRGQASSPTPGRHSRRPAERSRKAMTPSRRRSSRT